MIFEKKKFSENLSFTKLGTRIKGTLHEDQYKFLIISRLIFLRMRNISDKICRGNQNTHFVFSNFFF